MQTVGRVWPKNVHLEYIRGFYSKSERYVVSLDLKQHIVVGRLYIPKVCFIP